jgi:hypothetical protein
MATVVVTMGCRQVASSELAGRESVDVRGRSCPTAYRYQPEVLAQPARLEADTLYVVGGLYGNPVALWDVLKRAEREPGGPAAIVFNGDFHWLDVDLDDFRVISQSVLAHHATKGNVEAELASDEDAGCGCAYPDYVGDDVVERSNRIMTRLRATAGRFPELVRRMGVLPRYLTASVAGERVGIVHGDPEAVAGWRLALEAMEPGDPAVRRQVGWRGRPTTPADLLDWFGRVDVTVFVSTHTGLPYAQVIPDGRRHRLVVNNGTAGLPNFAGTGYGLFTRLSSDPDPRRQPIRHHRRRPALRCSGAAVRPRRVEGTLPGPMPPGGPGHRSYFTRLTRGTHLRLPQAARTGVQLTAANAPP